jgi:predicted  nucleic acid-binding Zn-ribbon protein
MTLSKRGLGRGLEVLLADITSLTGIEQASTASNNIDDQLAEAQAIIENLQNENHDLLLEIESLKKLLDELESIIRADLI